MQCFNSYVENNQYKERILLSIYFFLEPVRLLFFCKALGRFEGRPVGVRRLAAIVSVTASDFSVA